MSKYNRKYIGEALQSLDYKDEIDFSILFEKVTKEYLRTGRFLEDSERIIVQDEEAETSGKVSQKKPQYFSVNITTSFLTESRGWSPSSRDITGRKSQGNESLVIHERSESSAEDREQSDCEKESEDDEENEDDKVTFQ